MTQKKLDNLNPNGISKPNGNFFGLSTSIEESNIIFLSVPWDVTTSYNAGTSEGPQAILEASVQIEWEDFHLQDAWKIGHGTIPISLEIKEKNQKMRSIAKTIIDYQTYQDNPLSLALKKDLKTINQASKELNDWVYDTTKKMLEYNKLIALIGGDHSVPLGLIKALTEKHNNYGILHIDAHADLRQAYEGFIYSHASIMYNVLQLDSITHLVQVGIRDICEQELEIIRNDPRIIMFNDWTIKTNQYQGISWDFQCQQIVDKLPDKVYISFDIDGLDPRFCPNTGTPVPGGLDFSQVVYLIQKVVDAGKVIIGFDLCEVAPGSDNEWDGNVGARLLYKLANLMYLSNR
ncbi:agmatinase family protein [Crocosphaera sp. UHCC 0190]|uniref:agmatinase family protein n=1 Tax=Crocosphaera sp. UHCC 0190 TaxID=3110246 RepID=UPI002B20E883|nr:agmatinase family protein [Crocosphaera sp. UHCC 0190]MEA5508394.1 agmatinase family protein [Crocosphaera sp. UHCC 0190]